MSWKILLLVAVLVFFVYTVWAVSQPHIPDAPEDLSEMELALERLVSSRTPPGLSVVVMKNGAQVYSRGFGWADQSRQLPAGPETVYHWWSLTKVASAIAVLQLYDEGLLSLDEPVKTYLPYFQAELDGKPAPPITIRQLLRHTSGLPDPMPAMIGWVHYEDEIYNQSMLLRRHLPQYNRLKFAPDSDSAYSNLGYMVLGAVIEQVSGEAYEAYMEKAVLQPLGMTGTGFLYPPGYQPDVAAGSHPLASFYTPMLPFLLDMNALVRERSGATLWFNPVYLDVTPSSGLLGSVDDAAKLAQAFLGGKILSEESRALMLPAGFGPTGRPLGWAEYHPGGRTWVQHQGGGPGFAALMRIYPDEELVILLMANSTHLPSGKIAHAFADLDW